MSDPLKPEALRLAERIEFLASGQDDPHSVALAEAASELRRLHAEVERLTERNAQWFTFAVAVGERLRCLPSSFPDANAHILRALDAAFKGARNG